MAEQRRRAKADAAARKHAHADLTAYRELVDAGPTEFTGFDELTSQAKILGIFVDGKRVPVVDAWDRRVRGRRPRRARTRPHPAVRRVRWSGRRRRHHQRDRVQRERQGRRHRRAEDRENPVGAPRQRGVGGVRRRRHHRCGRGPRLAQGRHPRALRYPHGARRAATSLGPQRCSSRIAEPAGLPSLRLQPAGRAESPNSSARSKM